jgi:hypothetical protein
VYAELTRELIERQECGVPRVVSHRQAGALNQVRWRGPQSAVPHAERIQRHVDPHVIEQTLVLERMLTEYH